jgi:N-acetylmuramoyl-L-alanine amidase
VNGLLSVIAVAIVAAASVAPAPASTTGAASASPLAALKGATVAVDPGHNGGNASHPEVINRLVPAGGFKKECDTTGTATNDGLSESSFNLAVAQRLRKLLEAAGAKVVMTRTDDRGVGPCINRRAAIGNRAKADVAISIHADGADAGDHGFHVIRPGLVRGYTGPIVKPSSRLAVLVRNQLDRLMSRSNYIGHGSGLDRRTDLGGLNLSKVPKVLVELGNMRNAGDASRQKSVRWQGRVALALRRSLGQFLSGR